MGPHFTLLNQTFVALFISIFSTVAVGQSSQDAAKFYTGISPVILAKDGIEINFLNSLTSFWLATQEFNPLTASTRTDNRYRFTRFQHLLRVNYGFSQSGRWDLGAELQFTHSRLDDEARSSPLRVLGGDTESGQTFRGLSLVGIRLRAVPFESLPELTIQATGHFPINPKENLRAQLGAQRVQVGLLATFYQQFNPRVFCFLQGDWRTHIRNDELKKTSHTPSLGGYLVFDARDQVVYIFPGLVYSPTFQEVNGSQLRRINQQLLGSLGVLYQPVDAFGVMLNWQVPFILESGSVSTEWVRESFTAFTLGLRVVL